MDSKHQVFISTRDSGLLIYTQFKHLCFVVTLKFYYRLGVGTSDYSDFRLTSRLVLYHHTMADAEMLDLDLDQIIERKRRGGGGGRIGGRGGREGRGSFRGRGGFPFNSGPRHALPPPPRAAVWVPTNKIIISNLAETVTGSDIHELFADHGRIRFSALHHDGVGRSLGTADIVYEREEDAQKAIRVVLPDDSL